MAKDTASPLTDADLKTMNEQLSELQRADDIADRAIRAGIDVAEQKKRIAEARTQILRIKQQFFPGR